MHSRTDNAQGVGLVNDGGEAEITNLNLPCGAVDKDVVALDITVNDRWVLRV